MALCTCMCVGYCTVLYVWTSARVHECEFKFDKLTTVLIKKADIYGKGQGVGPDEITAEEEQRRMHLQQ